MNWKREALEYYENNRKLFTNIPMIRTKTLNCLEVRPLPLDHPSTGNGLFATELIPPNRFIINYEGNVQHDKYVPNSNDYCIHLHGCLVVEAAQCGNIARFINDYYNVKTRPNVAFDTYMNETGELQVGVWSLNVPIQPEEELLVTYGLSFWKSRGVNRTGPEWDEDWDC
jgi:hypothetical protein